MSNICSVVYVDLSIYQLISLILQVRKMRTESLLLDQVHTARSHMVEPILEPRFILAHSICTIIAKVFIGLIIYQAL